MAGNLIVTCPECEKKFKPKADVSGKKIKCPFCAEPFVVPISKEAKADKAKPDKTGKAREEATKADPVPEAAPQVNAAPNDDNDIDPYGIKQVDLVPRCPNCTQEMAEHQTICLACGYNTMTRQWGKTTKTFGVTTKRHMLYQLPPVAVAVTALIMIITLMFFYFFVPDMVVGDGYTDWLDSEAIRMWLTLGLLFVFWAAGVFCFYRFIQKPIPDEIEMD